ncbi:MAG: sigma-70 family RNA polymerase sigma factor [Chloroflexi bacterium]|nr:sigma-70 family RNA polymerase sigma factor [Chloroflexota bacterium]
MNNEAELIRRSQEGDLESFNLLVEAYQAPVYNLALRMLGRADVAEDAAQEAFIRAFRALKKFHGGSFRAWLFSIAANACKDELRRRGRRPVSLETLEEEDALPEPASSPAESPEEVALSRELHRAVARGLGQMPEEQRLAVILRDIQGLSYEEIAQATGTALGTVKSRLLRGRLYLRDYLLRQRELLPEQYRLKDRGRS